MGLFLQDCSGVSFLFYLWGISVLAKTFKFTNFSYGGEEGGSLTVGKVGSMSHRLSVCETFVIVLTK